MNGPDHLVGRTLSHYSIYEKIGAGGMGAVYRARDTRLQRDVAVKVLTGEALGGASARKRLQAEALTISRLNHPNIATVHDFDCAEGLDFLVMELVDGEVLDAKLRLGPVAESDVLRWGGELAAGLAAAHGHGIVHRDLKPSNVRITADGRLKILDFGLARFTPEAASLEATETVVDSGAVAGTLPYMAPEQLRGEGPNPRTDLYAAGLVLYEMATGRRAFPETGPLLIDAILHRPVAPVAATNPSIAPALQTIIAKACDKEPARRYQSAADLAVDLGRCSESPDATRAPVRSTRGRWIAVAGSVLLVMAAFVATRQWLGKSDLGVSSLAVLPFTTPDGQSDYVSDGLTATVTTELAQLPGVRVMAETTSSRYRGRSDLAALGREMDVDALLTGRITGTRQETTLSAELVHVATGTQLWSGREVLARNNLPALPRAVAQSIAERLQLTLPAPARRRLDESASDDPEAYDLFLRGTYLLNSGEKANAIKSFSYLHRALERDPDFPEALAALSLAYEDWGPDAGIPVSENIIRARRFAEKAIEIDDSLAAGHAALAATLFGSVWDVSGAEREARRAVELNPSSGFARGTYANVLLAQRRFAEAIEQLRAAQQNDPGTIVPASRLCVAHFLARDYERALATAARVQEVEPGALRSHVAWIHAVSGRPADAIASFQGLLPSESGKHADALRAAASAGDLKTWFRSMGERGEAIKGAGLSGVPDDAGVPSAINLAWYWAGAGDADRAFHWLERAYERRHTHLMFLKVDPRWDPIRSDPRFSAMLARVDQR